MIQVPSFFGLRESREGCLWIQGEARSLGNKPFMVSRIILCFCCRGIRETEENLACHVPCLLSHHQHPSCRGMHRLPGLVLTPEPGADLRTVSGHKLHRKGLPGLPGLGRSPLGGSAWGPSTADLALASEKIAWGWKQDLHLPASIFISWDVKEKTLGS